MASGRIGSWLEVEPGVEIYYEDAGQGPPLVLIPGWTFTTRVFEHQVTALSRSFRVIAFDPRSHGRSTVTLEGNNHSGHAADLMKLLAHLEVERPTLVGWSTGAYTAWQVLRDHGAAGLAGLVMIDMPPLGMSSDPDDWVEGSLPDMAGFFGAVQTAAGQRAAVTAYAEHVMLQQDLTPELTSWVVEQSVGTPPLIAANLIACAAFGNYLEEAKAADAELPQLFVVAEHWAESARPFLAEHCPNSQVEVFGGHLMFWEHPGQFNPLLARFAAKAAARDS